MQRKVALITGASRGIGAAIAEAFAKKGYDLILTASRSAAELDKCAESLRKTYGVGITTYLGDLAEYENCEALFSQVDTLNVLINNAGISHVGLLSDMTPEEWNRILATNLSAPFYCSKLAIPFFLRQGCGKIVNISSVWGEVGASMEVAYSATKGGLNAFTRALAKELAPSGITVNAISCGLIDTSMNACFSKEDKDNLVAQIPADRIGEGRDVAELALYLAEATDYLNGQVIRVDGCWI